MTPHPFTDWSIPLLVLTAKLINTYCFNLFNSCFPMSPLNQVFILCLPGMALPSTGPIAMFSVFRLTYVPCLSQMVTVVFPWLTAHEQLTVVIAELLGILTVDLVHLARLLPQLCISSPNSKAFPLQHQTEISTLLCCVVSTLSLAQYAVTTSCTWLVLISLIFLFKYFNYIYFCVSIVVCICHGTHVEVERTL